MDTSGAVLIGDQRPALWTAPPRHAEPVDGCRSCDRRLYDTGCGNYVAQEVLAWSANYWSLFDWQEWYLTEGLGVKPNQRFSAVDVCGIIPRQNGKGTCLEVRELAGLFVLNERKIIHTAHQFSTAQEHFDRCMEVIDGNYDLSKWLLGKPSRTHGLESIKVRAKPTLIFAAQGKMVRKSYVRKLEFHARTSKKSRGFTSNCLVIDESMYLNAGQIGAIRPTLRAIANHQVWLMGSAGMKESVELASYHEDIVDDTKDFVGAEWGGLVMHDAKCPRSSSLGRKSNDYVYGCVNTDHIDRDIPEAWARSNPSYGLMVEEETFRTELKRISDVTEGNRELLNVGEWPIKTAAWKVFPKDVWDSLVTVNAGTVAPVTLAVEVDEDGRASAIGAAWYSGDGKNRKLVVSNPAGCVLETTDGLLEQLAKVYGFIRKTFGPVIAIVVPKDGPAAGVGDEIEKVYRDRVVRATTQDQATAFAFFTQQVNERKLFHRSEADAPDLYQAIGSAETRIVGDGGQTWKRRDALKPVSPAAAVSLAAWILNKKRAGYDITKSIG